MAFCIRYGHFKYLVMSFRLTNAPAIFQAYINKALAGYIDIFCMVYLDDILVYSDSLLNHEDHMKKMLKRLQRYQLYASLKKCAFSTNQVEFFRFIILLEGVSIDQSKVDTIQSWPVPESYQDV